MENYSYQIVVNIEGGDKTIIVPDMGTAQLLLNDSDAENLESEAFQTQQYQASNFEELADSLESEAFQTEDEENIFTNEEGVIWIKKKPTDTDIAATHLMLRLREQKKEQFNNKKNNKRQLWAGIAEELTRNQFMLGANGGERCRQKFANLTKSYLKYLRNQKTTGAAFMEHPPFFEEVHSILGEKHKTQLKHLVDSLEDEPMPEA
ncbi:uncharacterized protein LOC123318355 [Coccinella septempunctata]|uniref:uncharacterized protein LOC123318355 n=1 Tax=Coccinella septempunctata TaxID=41139 RepID=UPI001D0785CE|nr:uncharacterized protein LOC123318355 [Coccinella septempunctata]